MTITYDMIDIIVELRKKIGKGKDHIILISDESNEPVELCDFSRLAVRCGCGTNCNEKPVGRKHHANGFLYICKKHIHEQGYYFPE